MIKQTTEQLRAKAAWEQINEVPDNKIGDFSTLTDGAASLIQKVGFGQALAFWLAKRSGKDKNDPKNLLPDYLAEWLIDGNQPYTRTKGKTGTDLLDKIMNNNSSEYRILTNEAIAYLNWMKRFAKAKDKEGTSSE